MCPPGLLFGEMHLHLIVTFVSVLVICGPMCQVFFPFTSLSFLLQAQFEPGTQQEFEAGGPGNGDLSHLPWLS